MTDSPREPFYWLNKDSRDFLRSGYLLPGVTPEQRVRQIAERAEEILRKPGFADKFYDYMSRGWYSLSSPVWSNFGMARGLPISCFSSFTPDSMHGIFDTASEVAMMSKHGGGTAVYLGALRPRGAPIQPTEANPEGENGQSEGAVHFAQLFETTMKISKQGAVRRGSTAVYLPIEHPDIMEFLDIRTDGNPIQELQFAVTVTDDWMQAMIDGDRDKRKTWAKVLQKRSDVGSPYITFIDNVNRSKPQVYHDNSMDIYASNLCVTGDQIAVTSSGLRRVKDLADEGGNLVLFDGERAVNASPMRLIREDAQVYKIVTSGGREHRVTGDHKVKTRRGMVAAEDLIPGVDEVAYQYKEGLFGDFHDPDMAYLLGLYQSDGTQTDERVFLDVWEGKTFGLIPEIEATVARVYEREGWRDVAMTLPNGSTGVRKYDIPKFVNQSPTQGGVAKKRLGSAHLKRYGFAKDVIPEWVWRGTKETQVQYLRGMLYGDGTVNISDNGKGPIYLSISSTSHQMMLDLQIILSNLGIKARVYKGSEARTELMPDGKGGQQMYDMRATWRLVVGNRPDALLLEDMTGFLTLRGVEVERRHYRDNTKKFDKVLSVEPDGVEDVYCTTVDTDEHVWVANGIITSNCNEVMLPSSEDESFVCCLSSMNLYHYEEWEGTDAVQVLTYFLDAVMSEFIEKAKDIPHFHRAVRFAERHRALGLGVLGYHSFLQSKSIPFDTFEATVWNARIFRYLEAETNKATESLARLLGEPELLKGYGRRNTTTMALAPTTSSSFILGQVSQSIEPLRSNYFIKDLAKSKTVYQNPELKRVLSEKYGRDEEAVWESILQAGGSVQHLAFMDDHDKAVFKTFAEISPMDIVQQAGQRQKWIDQGQSLNLMIHPDMPTKDVNQVYIEAWRQGVKGLYYQHSFNAAQEYTREMLECSACAA